jgi:F-type H+-transporting ATPase subunit b
VWYVGKSPVMGYLTDRRDQLRSDLVGAAQMRKTANEQIADIEQRLSTLPGDLETLKTQGEIEIAAEEARIAQAAEAERERLLEQTRRELDQQVRLERDDLRVTAAELATSVARSRITELITPADQERLMTRYLGQMDDVEGRS